MNLDHVPYDQWEREGLLNTTDGNVVHYGAIEAFIEELGTRYDIREIAYERWGAVQMSQNLQDSGFTVVSFGRGFTDMSLASKEFMKLALEGRLHHGGQQSARLDGRQHPHPATPSLQHQTRQAEITEKIDGFVATIMALDRAIRCAGHDTDASVYDQRGLLVL